VPSVGSGAPGGVPVTQSKLTNYDDLKAPGKGFNWDPHRTQDTYTEATDEDRTAFGLGVGVRNTLELEVPWGGKVASTQDGVTKEPSSLTWQLHPRVKPGTQPDSAQRTSWARGLRCRPHRRRSDGCMARALACATRGS